MYVHYECGERLGTVDVARICVDYCSLWHEGFAVVPHRLSDVSYMYTYIHVASQRAQMPAGHLSMADGW